MITEKSEYDSAIGGNIELPENVTTYNYASNCLKEIKTLLKDVRNPKQTKLIFQTLPKHMRRRAMTHNPKRLPRRYRQAHMAQMKKSGLPEKSKRPSRKYRRKPNNLLLEYQRRQRKNIWLETHIWHAKRFHMINAWGYRLPYKTCDKTYRSCYRATSKHCLLQDISYIGCIEISGPIDLLKCGFERMTNNKFDLSIYAKTYTNGYREGTIDFYHTDSYPYNGFGRVNFMWKPAEMEEEERQQQTINTLRTIWIFVHPSIYEELCNELITIFNLLLERNETDDMLVDSSLLLTQTLSPPPPPPPPPPLKATNINETIKYVNKLKSITLMKLRDKLNRFRLTGPLSQSVLSKAFKTKCVKDDNNDWSQQFYSMNLKNNKANEYQSLYWNKIKTINSPGELISNMILALNIEDPRLNRPNRRTKALPDIPDNLLDNNYKNNEAIYEIPKYNSISAIWNEQFRERIQTEKMSTNDLCKLRNKHCLVPGEKCSFENNMQPVPVLLIQRPGCQNSKYNRLGYGCGWDVICPVGYGISIWICLIMWGAKAGGIRECDMMNRECGIDEFFPDTISGQKISELNAKDMRTKYFKMPPNKRPNYNKLSIASPFKCPWLELIREWNNEDNSVLGFYVLREKDTLASVNKLLHDKHKKTFKQLNLPNNCLIPINLIMEGRGKLNKFSIICLPNKSDLKMNIKNRNSFSNEPIFTEPIGIDVNENMRKELRLNHIKLLKRLRRRRIRIKYKQQKVSEKRVIITSPGTAKLIAEQYRKLCELWLPDNVTKIRKQCSREVFGYLTQSDFSFTKATVSGNGFVTVNGLEQLKKRTSKCNGHLKVLVRSTNTRHYRIATMKLRI